MIEDPLSTLLASALACSERFVAVETLVPVVRRNFAQEDFDAHGTSEVGSLFLGLLSNTNEGVRVVRHIFVGHRRRVLAVIAQSVAFPRVEFLVEIR